MHAAGAFASATGDEVTLFGDFNARWALLVSKLWELTIKKLRIRTVPCSDVPLKVANWSLHALCSHRSYLDEHRIDDICFPRHVHGAAFATYTLEDQVLLARNGVASSF